MGLEAAAIAGIASAVVGAGSAAYGMHQSNKQAKTQASAANAMADAMEQQPTVQTSKVAEQQTQDTQASEQAVNTEARRRYSLAQTVNKRPSLNSGILTGRKTLG